MGPIVGHVRAPIRRASVPTEAKEGPKGCCPFDLERGPTAKDSRVVRATPEEAGEAEQDSDGIGKPARGEVAKEERHVRIQGRSCMKPPLGSTGRQRSSTGARRLGPRRGRSMALHALQPDLGWTTTGPLDL